MMVNLLANQANTDLVTRNGDGSDLFESTDHHDTVQTLMSAPDTQSCINYTDVDGHTSLFQSVSKGNPFIVDQLIVE